MVTEYRSRPDYWECPECGKRFSNRPMQCTACRHIGDFNPVHKNSANGDSAAKPKRVELRKPPGISGSEALNITEVSSDSAEKLDTGSDEFNRVLGGGMNTDGIVAITGDPGAGKSTLMMSVSSYIARTRSVLYISGEESGRGLKDRASRMCVITEETTAEDINLFVVFETDIEILLREHIPRVKPDVIVVDSINTLYSSLLDGAPGQEKQLMYAAHKLQEYAKGRNVAVFMISQTTKAGEMAGSNKLLHLVDVILHLAGDNHYAFRLLRAVKNRWENTGEVAVFRMTEEGLKDVPNPSEEFLAERMVANPGSSIAVTMEGERPIVVEVQALTNTGSGGNPARQTYGLDRGRAFIITSVMDAHLSYIDLTQDDLIVNVVGGMKISETAADLSVVMAIVSSQHRIAAPAEWAAIGEVGLTGEIRSVPRMQARVREAAKIGCKHIVIPPIRESMPKIKGIKIHEAKTVDEAVRLMFNGKIDFGLFD